MDKTYLALAGTFVTLAVLDAMRTELDCAHGTESESSELNAWNSPSFAIGCVERCLNSVCFERVVRSEDDLNRLFDRIEGQFEVADQCNGTDAVVALKVLYGALAYAKAAGRAAFDEAFAGFPQSHGCFSSWQAHYHFRTHSEMRTLG